MFLPMSNWVFTTLWSISAETSELINTSYPGLPKSHMVNQINGAAEIKKGWDIVSLSLNPDESLKFANIIYHNSFNITIN